MKLIVRTLFLAAIACAAADAASQTNPMARGNDPQRDTFYYRAIQAPRAATAPLQNGNNALSRPVGRFGPVTPVPEPSQWAMMLAGLALVGWIVRRNSKR